MAKNKSKPDKSDISLKEKLSTVLFFFLIIVLSVASVSSLRWISPSIHMDTKFGSSRDLTYACIIALTVLLIAAITFSASKTKVRRNFTAILKISIVILLAGIVISCVCASDKAVAFYAGSGLIIALLVMLTTFKLVDTAWKINLAIIVLISLGTTFALKTWLRELYEIDQTYQHYLKTRQAFWAKQGKSLEAPEVKVFEARLKSRDNGGFFFHGNLGGAYLTVVFLVSLSFVAKRIRDKIAGKQFADLWLISSILISGFILSAVILTMSKSAILACILSLIAIAILWLFRNFLISHFRLAVILTLIIIVCISSLIIGYGLIKHTLPTLSLAYRWQYWQGAYAMFKDHYLTGVGPANFGYYYLRYKLPQAEEEVSSPHNFIVQGFTELGIIGGTGLLLFIFAIFYQIAKSARENNSLPRSSGNSLSAGTAMLIITFAFFAVVFIFNQTNLPGLIYLLAEWLPYIFIFAITFVICCFDADKIERIDTSAPSAATKLFLTCALIAFVLGNLTNFSLFEPSTQILFFFLAGLTLSAFKSSISRTHRKSFSVFVPAISLIIIVSYTYYLFTPALLAESAANQAQEIASNSPLEYDKSYQTFVKLTNRYTYDAHLPAQAGKRELILARSSRNPVKLIQQSASWYALACKRADVLWKFFSCQAQCYLILTKLDPADRFSYYAQAEQLFEQARKRAPLSRTLAKDTGLTYYTHLRETPKPSQKLLIRAHKHLTDALRLNNALPKNSIRRFSNEDVKLIRDALKFVDAKLQIKSKDQK